MVAVIFVGWVVMIAAMAGAAYILATTVAMYKLTLGRGRLADGDFPAVSVLIPLHGDPPGWDSALSSLLLQDYPGAIQIVCGAQDASDPAIAAVEKIKASRPAADIACIADPRLHGTNRKISNLINMMSAAKHSRLVMLDSDMEVPSSYLRTIDSALAAPGTGLATCLYAGRGVGFWACLSAMGITHQFFPSACVAVAGRISHPCFGSTIALERATLEKIGGFAAFADYLADDFEIGRAVRSLGLRMAYPPMILSHVCSEDSFGAVWLHELRWARTNRVVEPVAYRLSFLAHPFALAILAVLLLAFRPIALVLLAAVMLARLFHKAITDRIVGRRTGPYWMLPVRDLLSFTVYLASLFGSAVRWQESKLRVDRRGMISQVRKR